MRYLILAGVVLACLLPASATTYTTTFPGTENPISEGGKWVNGGTTGLDWTNIQTTPGKATGLESGTIPFSDATATLQGISWGADQSAQGTVFMTYSPPTTTCGQEIELRLRTTITAHSITGYEIDYSANNGGFAIVRWNGPLANPSNSNNGFTVLLTVAGTGNVVHNGDIVKATIVGSTITAYRNGAQIGQVTDATYASGNPGIGLNYTQNGGCTTALRSTYGVSAFTATDAVAPPPGPYTILNQPPITNTPYPAAYYNQQLPNAGSGGPMTHLMPNSDAMIAHIMDNTFSGPYHTPGSDDFSSFPIYPTQATDPLWTIQGCGGNSTTAAAINGTTFNAPTGLPYSGFANGSSDSNILIWNQKTGTVNAFYTFGAGQLPGTPGTFRHNNNIYCSADNWNTGRGYQSGSLITGGLSPFSGIMRIQELLAGVINHGLYGYSECSGTDHGLYGGRTVFPVGPDGGSPGQTCTQAGIGADEANRPPNGSLVFLDYTFAQLDCLDPAKPVCPGTAKLGTIQYAIMRALTRFGVTIGGTGNGDSIALPSIESETSYSWLQTHGYPGAQAIADSFTTAMNAACVLPCKTVDRTGGGPPGGGACAGGPCVGTWPNPAAPHSTRQWNTAWWANIPSIAGKTVFQHLHIADPCVTIGLQGLPSAISNGVLVAGCASPATNPHLTASPTSFSFGSQVVGPSSAATVVTTLTNDGTASATISSETFTSGVNFAFAGIGACTPGVPIAPGGTCQVIAKFVSGTPGTFSDSLTIASNATNSPNVIGLSGTATQPGGQVQNPVPPGGLNFGSQQVNTTSGSQSVTYQNVGSGPLTFSSITVSGDFAIVPGSSTCPVSPATLAASATCSLSLRFTPTVVGTRNGLLSFNSNDPLSPQTVSLTGIGQQGSIPPTGIVFQQGVIGAH